MDGIEPDPTHIYLNWGAEFLARIQCLEGYLFMYKLGTLSAVYMAAK